jgi:23S rRNA pseudouridine1911/1915/1917 synthase
VYPRRVKVLPMTISKKGPGTPGQSPLSYQTWRTDPSSRGAPLAKHLAKELLLSEEEAVDLADFGSVQINGLQERNPLRILEGGEDIRIYWPKSGTRRFYEIDPERILYRDRYLLVYDKESGVPSQQTPADAYNNLFAALQRYLKKEDPTDPYIALHHRLDQETSGVMVFALDRSVNRKLGESFEKHKVVKDYLAWVDGTPSSPTWVSREDITRKSGRYGFCPTGQGKSAETAFEVLHTDSGSSLVLAHPLTGRTHQIRLHLAAAGHPITGDRLYGGKPAKRLFLHAYRLRLPHPAKSRPLIFLAPIPDDWPEPRSIAIPDQEVP